MRDPPSLPPPIVELSLQYLLHKSGAVDYEAKAAEVTGLTCIAGQDGMRFVARRKLHNWNEDVVRLRYVSGYHLPGLSELLRA